MKQAISERSGRLCLCLFLAAALSPAAPTGCKKEAPADHAVALFVIGTVTVERPGGQARPVLRKDELRAGDTVATGARSLLTAQLGEETIIEVEAGTTVRFASLVSGGSTKLVLERGGVFSRVQRLAKNANYQVQTRTSLAAVRGTEFSVTSGDGGSVVAVSGGTVAVGRPSPEGGAAEETMVEKGSAAEIHQKIAVRPLNEGEKKDFARFETIRPVRDLDSADESDLIKREDEYRRNSGADEDAGMKPGPQAEKKAEPKAEKKAGPKTGPAAGAEDPVAAKVRLWTGKPVYSASEPVVVFYKDMPDYRNCWIDVSRAADSDGRYRSYNWTYSATSGQMTFSNLGLEPGVYEVRAHFSKGSAVSKRFRFRVR